MPPASPPTLSTPRPARAAGECQTAEALLGPSHPLVGLLSACQTMADEIVVVAALQVAGVVLLGLSATFALALTVAATAAQLALGMRFGMLRAYRRELCRDLVIDGRGRLPLAALKCELRRLRDPRLQARLARSLEELARTDDHHRHEVGLGPRCTASVCWQRLSPSCTSSCGRCKPIARA